VSEAKTRSPIKDKPLRLPGQSLQEEGDKLWEEELLPYLLSAVLFVVLAVWEWLHHFNIVASSPWLLTVTACVSTAWAVRRFFRLRPKMRAIRQGLEGEKAVGQFLDRLREQGYHVFHDVVGEGFNVDHVLLGPGGVFTVETKTWSKPVQRDARIDYDGESLTVTGRSPDREPIVQAKAQARWLAQVLIESTGRRLKVQPVVLFPGWFVAPAAAGCQRDVWVLEPKALPAFVAQQTQVLAVEDAKLAAYHLSRFIRAGERERSDRR
jgi:Nuclease-related domain